MVGVVVIGLVGWPLLNPPGWAPAALRRAATAVRCHFGQGVAVVQGGPAFSNESEHLILQCKSQIRLSFSAVWKNTVPVAF